MTTVLAGIGHLAAHRRVMAAETRFSNYKAGLRGDVVVVDID